MLKISLPNDRFDRLIAVEDKFYPLNRGADNCMSTKCLLYEKELVSRNNKICSAEVLVCSKDSHERPLQIKV